MNNEIKKPWLSVIVPVYNAEKYIVKCINSVLAQSFSDFELILVDDGSKDASGSICRQYAQKDERVRYYLKENGGSIQARVFGAEQSTGYYFTFCDADDYYASKHAFETMHNEMNNENHSILQFNYIKKFNHLYKKVNISSRYYADFDSYYNNEYPKLLCSIWKEARLTTNVTNKIYREELKKDLPSYDSFGHIFWGDDLIMNLYLLEHCRSVLFIPDYLFIYRQFSGGTSRFNERTMHDLNRIKEYQLQYIDRYEGNRKDDIISVCFMEMVGWFFSFIKQGLSIVGEERMKELINESLELPSFKKAREYYLSNPQIDNELITLFKHVDADEYISKAKAENTKKNIKNDLVSILKRIYKSI